MTKSPVRLDDEQRSRTCKGVSLKCRIPVLAPDLLSGAWEPIVFSKLSPPPPTLTSLGMADFENSVTKVFKLFR